MEINSIKDIYSLPVLCETDKSMIYEYSEEVVIKKTRYKDEYDLSLKLKGEYLYYTANVIDCCDFNYDKGVSDYFIVKEKIEESLKAQEIIVSLCRIWDDDAESALSLFDHIEQYLSGPSKYMYNYVYTPYKFQQFLYDKRMWDESRKFSELTLLVNELRKHQLYNIDWHPNNFGLKDGRLALFELGGAKIKE